MNDNDKILGLSPMWFGTALAGAIAVVAVGLLMFGNDGAGAVQAFAALVTAIALAVAAFQGVRTLESNRAKLIQDERLMWLQHNAQMIEQLDAKSQHTQLAALSSLLERLEELGDADGEAQRAERRTLLGVLSGVSRGDGDDRFQKVLGDGLVRALGAVARKRSQLGRRSPLAAVDLQEARLDHVFWRWVDARGIDLWRASLRHASLRQAYLIKTIFKRADLTEAVLDGAKLTKADLRDATLDGASLRNARLRGALLDNASLRGADLHGADFTGASLDGAVLDGALNLDAAIGLPADDEPSSDGSAGGGDSGDGGDGDGGDDPPTTERPSHDDDPVPLTDAIGKEPPVRTDPTDTVESSVPPAGDDDASRSGDPSMPPS